MSEPIANEALHPEAGPEINAPGPKKREWDPKGKRNIIIITSVVVAVIVTMFLIAGSRNRDQGKVSTIDHQLPSPTEQGVMTPDEVARLKEEERKRLGAAAASSTSAIGEVVTPLELKTPTPTSAAAPAPVTPEKASPTAPASSDGRVTSETQPAQSDPQEQNRVAAIKRQAGNLAKLWGVSDDASGKASGTRDYVWAGGAQETTQQAPVTQATTQVNANNGVVVVPAFDPVYSAEMLNTFDSDERNLVRARIVTGPLSGAVLKGGGQKLGEGARISFSEASWHGRSFKVAAIAIDEKTSNDVVEGKYDGRYAQRFLFPILAEGVKAYSTARAQTGTQVIAINVPNTGVGTVQQQVGAQQTPPPSAEQARQALIAASAGTLANQLQKGPQEGLVTIPMRQSIGIIFIDPVYQSDIDGRK